MKKTDIPKSGCQSSASSVSAATAETTEDTTAITTAKIMIKSPPPKTTNIEHTPFYKN